MTRDVDHREAHTSPARHQHQSPADTFVRRVSANSAVA
jgi:hypothetical protein